MPIGSETSRPLFDPGWLFLLAGFGLLGSLVLIPAMEDVEAARFKRDQVLAIEAHALLEAQVPAQEFLHVPVDTDRAHGGPQQRGRLFQAGLMITLELRQIHGLQDTPRPRGVRPLDHPHRGTTSLWDPHRSQRAHSHPAGWAVIVPRHATRAQ